MSETATTIEVPAAKKKLWDGFAKDLFWFVENQKNVYIAGEHGTGKTHVVLDMVKTMGYSYKYFSCATMDPWTSFVGVPVPTNLDSAGVPQHLKLVRPQEIGNVDVLIFDEFNRVRDETVHAAVMELVQFGTINQEPMNVKFVIAMVNPDDNPDYQVESTDPAVEDRFDGYFRIEANPSAAALAAEGIPEDLGTLLVNFWHENTDLLSDPSFEDYVSPRKLGQIGRVLVESDGNTALIERCWPRKANRANLPILIDKVRRHFNPDKYGSNVETTGSLGEPDPRIEYTKSEFGNKNSDSFKRVIYGNIERSHDEATQTAIWRVFENPSPGANGVGKTSLDKEMSAFGTILVTMSDASIAKMLEAMPEQKKHQYGEFLKEFVLWQRGGYLRKRKDGAPTHVLPGHEYPLSTSFYDTRASKAVLPDDVDMTGDEFIHKVMDQVSSGVRGAYILQKFWGVDPSSLGLAITV